MAHFVVLVVTAKKPTRNVLAKALQPFHEFECTGTDDEYVVNVNKLPAYQKEYMKGTTRRIRMPDGKLLKAYDKQFYRDPTPEEKEKIGIGGFGTAGGFSYSTCDWGDGEGHRLKVHFVPPGCAEVDVPYKDVMTFAEYIQSAYSLGQIGPDAKPNLKEEHKFGWMRVDENGNVLEAVDRTNLNAKWDWWVIGGRWRGFFKVKPGVRGKKSGEGYDSLRKRDVDIEAMRDEAGSEAGAQWDDIRAVVGDLQDFKSWDAVRAEHSDDIGAARRAYAEQVAMKRLREADRRFVFVDLEDYRVSREEHVQKARDKALGPFAFLQDGKWAEKGEMGWWGVVADEKADWPQQFKALWDQIPEGHWVTAVDCHI